MERRGKQLMLTLLSMHARGAARWMKFLMEAGVWSWPLTASASIFEVLSYILEGNQK